LFRANSKWKLDQTLAVVAGQVVEMNINMGYCAQMTTLLSYSSIILAFKINTRCSNNYHTELCVQNIQTTY